MHVYNRFYDMRNMGASVDFVANCRFQVIDGRLPMKVSNRELLILTAVAHSYIHALLSS